MDASPRRSVPEAAGRALGAATVVAVAACSTVLGIEADRTVGVPADASIDAPADATVDAPADAPPDPQVDAAVDAGAARDPWACIFEPHGPADPNAHVAVTLRVMDGVAASTAAGAVDGGSDLDTISGTWLPGVAVRACDLRDPLCLDSTTALTTDVQGAVTFDVTGDFAGFFDLRRSDLVPATLYPGRLVAGVTAVSYPAYSVTPQEIWELGKTITMHPVSLAPDGGLGHTVVTIYDCEDHQAPGVAVTYAVLGPKGMPFYFKGGLPTTAVAQTDSYGLAGAINVPEGTLTVTAMLTGDGGAPTSAPAGTTLGSTTFDVRPGAITFAWIRVRSL
jgi:hypothetical protein